MMMRTATVMYGHINVFNVLTFDNLFQYLRTKQKESIRKYHMELTRAGPICLRFLENAFNAAEAWDMTEVGKSIIFLSRH